MRIHLFTFLFLIVSLGQIQAQSFKDKFFRTHGVQFDATLMPSYLTESTPQRVAQYIGGSLIGYHYGLRYNIVELSDNQSIGIGIDPNVGILSAGVFSISETSGLLSASIPIEFSFTTGAGSTYNSSANNGFSIRGGIDLNFVPLFFFDSELNHKKFYPLPHLTLGYYGFGETASLFEMFLRYNFAKNVNSDLSKNEGLLPAIVLTIGFSTVIGY